MKKVAALILAGGKSERMRSPKPFLLMEGKTFVEKISGEYLRFGIKDIYLILNNQFINCIPEKANSFNVIPNLHPEYGRFYSLQVGLKQLHENDFVFVHNVDNPFVDPVVLQKMWRKRSKTGFGVPTFNGKGGHPTLIPKLIVKEILASEDHGNTLRGILQQYDRIEVEADSEKILTNINTWEEYEEHVLKLIPECSSD